MTLRGVFVIAPKARDSEWPRKKAVLEDVAGRAGWIVVMPGHLAPASMDKFLADIGNADLVLADLSFERPSSYYELGVAEALHKPISIIALAGTDIHQTVHRDGIAEYRTIDDYRRAVENALGAHGSVP